MQQATLLTAVQAAAVYFAVVYLCGFVLGAVRVSLVEPRLGSVSAVLIEAPILLGVSWFACRWCVRVWAVDAGLSARGVMGTLAFLLLMTAEFGLGAVLLGRSPQAQLRAFGSPAGVLGLAAQLAFAAFPLIVGR